MCETHRCHNSVHFQYWCRLNFGTGTLPWRFFFFAIRLWESITWVQCAPFIPLNWIMKRSKCIHNWPQQWFYSGWCIFFLYKRFLCIYHMFFNLNWSSSIEHLKLSMYTHSTSNFNWMKSCKEEVKFEMRCLKVARFVLLFEFILPDSFAIRKFTFDIVNVQINESHAMWSWKMYTNHFISVHFVSI